MESDCRKFSPNMFDKSKCQNCFRPRDVHSAEALEKNRASRNISKCGYLFVAPDWDFSVSANRTKRWQRRWFVLYDDGELTYSLDEYPDTVPQGTIHMNKVLDVSDAESATGNDFAIAITTPEKAHFIKGTSKEESKWWFDVLSRVVPRHLGRGKHKRNATFPCGKAVIPSPDVISQDYCSEDDIRLKKFSRPKFLSSSEVHHSSRKEWMTPDAEHEDVFSAKDDESHLVKNEIKGICDGEENDTDGEQINFSDSTDSINTTLRNNVPVVENPNNEKEYPAEIKEINRRNRHYLKQETELQCNQHSILNGVSKEEHAENQRNSATNASNVDICACKHEYVTALQCGSVNCNIHAKQPYNVENQSTASVDLLNSAAGDKEYWPLKSNLRKSVSLRNIPSKSDSETGEHTCGLRRYHSFRSSQKKARLGSCYNQMKNKFSSSGLMRCSTPSVLTSTPSNKTVCREPQYVSSMDTSDHHNDQVILMRSGWLYRQTFTKEWSRHWFVLKDSSLAYYRDSSAEHSGIMDGILDLNQVSKIMNSESDKHFAFSLLMWDGKKHILAAETEEMREIWMQDIQQASNLWSLSSKEDFLKNEIILPEHNFHNRKSIERVASPNSLNLLYSVDDKNSETSSSSDDQSEYFSLVDEDEDILCGIHQDEDIDVIPSLHHLNNVIHQNQFKSEMSDIEAKKILQYAILKDSFLKSEHKEKEFKLENVDILFEKNSDNDFQTLTTNTLDESGCYVCMKMRSKLITAKEEIRKLRNELREAQANFDNLEMFSYKLKQNMKSKEESYESQIALMSAKIDDLTLKFTLADRNYRQLKQKLKGEYKQEKRKSSLKNKDTLSLSKEYETKLSDLENKVTHIETCLQKEISESDNIWQARIKYADDSENSDVSIQTKLNSTEYNGFLSRYQTLKTRVKHIDDLITKSESVEKGCGKKSDISIQIQDGESSNSFDESDDSRNISFVNNLSGIQMLNVPVNELPWNLTEMHDIFTQKIQNLIEWLKISLEYICRQKENNDPSFGKKAVFVADLSEVLDYLCCWIEENKQNAKDKAINYIILFFIEVMNLVVRIEKCENADLIMINDISKMASKVIGSAFFIAFLDGENIEFSNLLNLISEIPQLCFICPLINKIFHKSEECSNCRNAESLLELEKKCTSILNIMDEVKRTRFQSLWNTLASIPVQDDGVQNSQNLNPILKYTSSVAYNVYQAAELQLTSFQDQSLYISKSEHEEIHSWCTFACKALKVNQEDFMTELKEKCPMINESTVLLHELSNAVYWKITYLVSELSFLNILSVILENLGIYLHKRPNNIRDKLPFKTWITKIKENYASKMSLIFDNAYECPKCIKLNYFLSSCGKDNNRPENLWESNSVFHQVTDRSLNFFNISSDVCNNFVTVPQTDLKDHIDINDRSCEQCRRLQIKLDNLLKEYDSQQYMLQQKLYHEVEALEKQLQANIKVHEQEMLEKERELESTKIQLQHLKTEYEDQIQNLKKLYHQTLQLDQDSIDEASKQQKYKAEIEDIKDIFRKGLLAIQNSHNRITSEMEKRHRDEIALLEIEKQKALELETQATITALEAIKKSHAKQLMEETAIIKEELMNKFQTSGEWEKIYCKYRSELDDLKTEILNISNIYSAKCVENIALEEEAIALRQQLKEAHKELLCFNFDSPEVCGCQSVGVV